MNVQLAKGQTQPEIPENAYIYLACRRLYELKFLPFADWKTRFMLYLNLALANGESFTICCRSTFDGDVLKLFKDFVRGQDPRHYYH